MARLLAACASGYVPAEGRLVVAPVSESPAAIRARALGARVEVLDPRSTGYSNSLLDLFREERIDWVCLEGRILNIHPALLPRFGGKGMYGIRVHEAVLAAGATETGCTVHFVTDEYDEGEAILARRCPVLAGDTPDSLADRVLELEHEAYPDALRKVVLGL